MKYSLKSTTKRIFTKTGIGEKCGKDTGKQSRADTIGRSMLITFTEPERVHSCLRGTCVLEITAIKTPLHSATTQIIRLFWDSGRRLSYKSTVNDVFGSETNHTALNF